MRSFFEIYQLEPFTEIVESFLTHQGVYAPLLLLFLEEAQAYPSLFRGMSLSRTLVMKYHKGIFLISGILNASYLSINWFLNFILPFGTALVSTSFLNLAVYTFERKEVSNR